MITGKKINELSDIIDPTLETVLPIVKIENGVADGTATKINLLNLVDFTFENRPENVLTNKNTSGNNLVLFGDETGLINTLLIGYNSESKGQQNILLGNSSHLEGESNICIGDVAQCKGEGSVSIGNQAYAMNNNSIAIGSTSQCYGEKNIAIGSAAQIRNENSNNCIAIGYFAQIASGNNIYQIGPGYSYQDNTLNVAFNSRQNYTLLTGDGKIPKERLPDDIGGGGAPTLKWYKNNTGSSITIDDTSSSSLVKIYKNGVLLEPEEDYSIDGTTLTLTTALIATDKITTEVF